MTCVICFRVGIPDVNYDCDQYLIGRSEEEKLNVFNNFLKLLNRHLNINSIGRNEVDEKVFKAGEEVLTDFAATLGKAPVCEECLEVISSFCELYHKIKTLELLLNNKMGTLMNIMFCAGKVPARVACFKDAFTKQETSGSSEQFDTLLQYKNRLVAKCSRKLASVYPQVIVERVSLKKDIPPVSVIYEELPTPPATSKHSAERDVVELHATFEFETPEMDMEIPMEASDEDDDFQPSSLPNISLQQLPTKETVDETVLTRTSPGPDSVEFLKLEEMKSPFSNELDVLGNMNTTKEEKPSSPSSPTTPVPEVESLPDNVEINPGFAIKLEEVKPNQAPFPHGITATTSGRSLRTIHKCDECLRTFSSKDKLSEHHKSQLCSSLSEGEDTNSSEMEEDNLSAESENDEESGDSSNEGSEVGAYDVKPYIDCPRDAIPPNFQMKSLKTKCPDCYKLFKKFYEMILHYKKTHLSKKGQNNPSAGAKLTIEIVNNQIGAPAKTHQQKRNIFGVYVKIEVAFSKVLSCPTPACGQLFFSEEDLESHRKLHGVFKCNFCDVEEPYAVNLARHELNEHTDNGSSRKRSNALSSPLHCSRCEKVFKRKYKYCVHFVREHLEMPRIMEQCCPICRDPHETQSWTEYGQRKEEYQHLFWQHNLLKDPAKDIFRCDQCLAYFLSLSQLRTHTRILHSSEENPAAFRRKFKRRVECKDCGASLGNKHALRRHRLRLHIKEIDKIPCTVESCRLKFEFQEELNAHIKYTHEIIGSKEEVCPKCGKAITGTGPLRVHLAAHERKEKSGEIPWVCETCGKKFKDKKQLDGHILLVHKGPEAWKFECKICGKKCFTNQKLEEHNRTHTNEKPFVCQLCGAAYGHRHNLRIHVNNKHGEVMQDIPRRVDTSNHFRRKRDAASSVGSGKKRAKRRKKVENGDVQNSQTETD